MMLKRFLLIMLSIPVMMFMIFSPFVRYYLIAIAALVFLLCQLDKNSYKSKYSSIIDERVNILTKKLEYYNDGHFSNIFKPFNIDCWKIVNNLNHDVFWFKTDVGIGNTLNKMSNQDFVEIYDKFVIWMKEQTELNKETLIKLEKIND